MKKPLQQIEDLLSKLLEEKATSWLGDHPRHTDLFSKISPILVEALRNSLKDENLAPHNFALCVPPEDLDQVRQDQPLLQHLADDLYISGQELGITFESAPTVTLFPDTALKPGQVVIKAIWHDEALTQTEAIQAVSTNATPVIKTPKSFLIVGGTQIFSLEEPIINIGRNVNNDIILSDTKVSRKHAQVRVVKGRHIIFDLDSSGGTYVNNKRITQSALHPGDVILVAGIPLVYGQDTPANLSETKEYSPPPNLPDSKSSTTTHRVTQKNPEE
jgi:hypothetical protein